MILDINTPKLKNIIINGHLTFDNTKDDLTLSSETILIKDGRLDIGTESTPFTKKAEIILLGDKFTNCGEIKSIRFVYHSKHNHFKG